MKKLTIAALLAGQVLSAVPAPAAPLDNDRASLTDQRRGAFAGARVRIPFGGDVRQRRIRAGLTLAPTLRTLGGDGASQLRIAEGLELGVTGREPVRLLLAGQDVRRLGAAQQEEQEDDDRGGGPSTLGWIAIGLGAAIVIVVGAAAICASDHDCIPSE